MLDVVFVAMFAVVPVLLWSWYLVRVRRNYSLHKRIQLTLAGILLVAVTAFEVEIRINGWRHLAEASPYYGDANSPGWVLRWLWIHLCFAVSTFVLWLVVVIRALRNFSSPPTPRPHSVSHRFWGRLAAIDMCCTAVTGWVFYYLAFIAS